MPFDSIVADANVLLSAAIGKAALRVLTEYRIKVHTTRFNLSEVERYLPRLTSKYRLSPEEVALQWRVLRVIVHEVEEYADHLEKARRELAARDPDDAHPLALARALELPLWSNDRDLGTSEVACYPTARLLSLLADQPSDVLGEGEPT